MTASNEDACPAPCLLCPAPCPRDPTRVIPPVKGDQ